jgi:uncharacterized SAM-binding protein YcdF (DUF218 family)
MILTLTLLVEPVALILIASCGGLLLHRFSRSGPGRVLAAAPAVFLVVLFATPLGANALLLPLENMAREAESSCRQLSDLNLVVLLTGGASGSARSVNDVASLHEESFRRAVAAIDYSMSIPKSRLLISGRGGGEVPEDLVVRALVLRLGYPVERLFTESESRDTFQSAEAALGIARKLGATRVDLITSAAHMPRALASYRKSGLDACAHPTDFEFVRVRFPTALLPQISALRKSTKAVHEYVGWAVYWLGDRA